MEHSLTVLTNRQVGGGIDFASTAFRISFNDLQPDRALPRERFYIVTNEGSLLLLTLGEDNDNDTPNDPSSSSEQAFGVETLLDIQPPLQTGEIVSVCGCGDLIVSPVCISSSSALRHRAAARAGSE